jgi:chaperone required for assembly of F1-ATPase
MPKKAVCVSLEIDDIEYIKNKCVPMSKFVARSIKRLKDDTELIKSVSNEVES